MTNRARQRRIDEAEAARARHKARKTAPGRLITRVEAARDNVATAMQEAARRGPLLGQLDDAYRNWMLEAGRIERELGVVRRLTGDAQKTAVKTLKARVESLEHVANRIVEAGFTNGLAPTSSEFDRLEEAAEHLEALDLGFRELDGCQPEDSSWKKSVDELRERIRLPDRFRR